VKKKDSKGKIKPEERVSLVVGIPKETMQTKT
jgi:hypothetical protein